jgi:hypothetical protein
MLQAISEARGKPAPPHRAHGGTHLEHGGERSERSIELLLARRA